MKTKLENAVEARLKLADLPAQKKILQDRLSTHVMEKLKVAEYLAGMSDEDVYLVTRPPKDKLSEKSAATLGTQKTEGTS